MIIARLLKLFLLYLVCAQLFAEGVDGYDYLNKIRQQAGMLPFTYNEQLAIAAFNHARYLNIHRHGGHGERYGQRGYTGSNHIDRIVRAGYPSRLTGENVSYHTGNNDVKASIDGLMSAIYHRFAFLSFKYDEVGIGSVQTPAFSTHVYTFGNARKRELCSQQSYTGRGQYVYQVCPDERFRVAPHELSMAETNVASQSVDIVVWPPNRGKDIPPAFYEEDPDPLPGYDVSGYPASISFNPSSFPLASPVLTRFQVFRAKDNLLLETAVQMNASNDGNEKFKPYEHALFPARRLEWGTRYRVEADYRYAEREESLSWEFTTRQLDLPMVTVTRNDQAIRVTPGQSFAIYVPPRGPRDGDSTYQSRFPSGMKLDIQIYDNHTLVVKVTGRTGKASIQFHGLDIQLLM